MSNEHGTDKLVFEKINGTSINGHPPKDDTLDSLSDTASKSEDKQESTEPKKKSMKINQHFTITKGTDIVDPFDLVKWELREASIIDYKKTKDQNNPVYAFRQKDVEFPSFWSQKATNIVAQKYFRGKQGTPQREQSVKQMIGRVTDWIADQGVKQGYLTEGNKQLFNYELRHILLHQYASFNSPVWFNVGVVEPPQVSACFILDVEDNMESILDLCKTEGLVFKGGSGAGLSYGKLRSKYEHLSTGGNSSGPVSFMRGWDSMAGAIKSGGRTRRSAKMAILPSWHLDIEEFIWCKAIEEKKARALKLAGFDINLDDANVFFQNANNSVRADDAFMKAVVNDENYLLRGVKEKDNTRVIKARDLMTQIATAAWECADPGMQFDDTINAMHTSPNSDRQYASNPCSEYLYLNHTSCNLASINLLKFLYSKGRFDTPAFKHTVDIVLLAMEILIDGASYPHPKIAEMTRRHRTLGLGYSNLGSLLMYKGLPYDSNEARLYASAITALMQGRSYWNSAKFAECKGPYPAFHEENNEKPCVEVIRKHFRNGLHLKENPSLTNLDPLLGEEAYSSLEAALLESEKNGVRNAQVTVLAPTGTISFLMDCDTTGVEPLFQLITDKTLVGGGSVYIPYDAMPEVLKLLNYSEDDSKVIYDYVTSTKGRVHGAPKLKPEHYKIFDTAAGWRGPEGNVESDIHYMGHLKMMSAIQPFISGAISKTVNLPETATIEDFYNAYVEAWKMGIKCVALYRDNCKAIQPLTTKKDKKVELVEEEDDTEDSMNEDYEIVKWPMPIERPSVTTKLKLNGSDYYLTVGVYPHNNRPGEIFLCGAKNGSTLAGFMGCFATAVSIGLQYGVPIEKFVDSFKNVTFEPKGFTGNPEFPTCASIVDYLFQWIEKRFLEGSLLTEQVVALNHGPVKPVMVDRRPMPWELLNEQKPTPTIHSSNPAPQKEIRTESSDNICSQCGSITVRSGACLKCVSCGSTSGCG